MFLTSIHSFQNLNNKIYAKRLDPYGHWYLSFERGENPPEFKGAFTELEYAEKAIDAYLLRKNKKISKEKDQTIPS